MQFFLFIFGILLLFVDKASADCVCFDSECETYHLHCKDNGYIEVGENECEVTGNLHPEVPCSPGIGHSPPPWDEWRQQKTCECIRPQVFWGSQCEIPRKSFCGAKPKWAALVEVVINGTIKKKWRKMGYYWDGSYFHDQIQSTQRIECTAPYNSTYLGKNKVLPFLEHQIVIHIINGPDPNVTQPSGGINVEVLSRIKKRKNGNHSHFCSPIIVALKCDLTNCKTTKTASGARYNCTDISCSSCPELLPLERGHYCSDFKELADDIEGKPEHIIEFVDEDTEVGKGWTSNFLSIMGQGGRRGGGLLCRTGSCPPEDPASKDETLPTAKPILVSASGSVVGFIISILILIVLGAVCIFHDRKKQSDDTDKVVVESKAPDEPAEEMNPLDGKSKDKSKLVSGIGMLWQHIEFTINDRKILNSISGIVKPGEMVAILGPSGSGKSSLLDILSGRRQENIKGYTKFIGSDDNFNIELSTNDIAYVPQHEILLHTQTVYETLMFSAALRTKVSAGECAQRVQNTMKQLGILHIAHSRIGNPDIGGISGGERRRVSIGIELVTHPAILFLDEPTSGLDSHSTLSLLTLLHKLTRSGVSILLSIHQVTHHSFIQFDKVLLLTRTGDLAFFGPPKSTPDYFNSIGYLVDDNINPAEFVLEVTQDKDLEVLKNITDSFSLSKFERIMTDDILELAYPNKKDLVVQSRMKTRYKKDDRVIVNTNKGELVGTIRFEGPTKFAKAECIGIELDEPKGLNDGTINERSYFSCAPSRGIFIKRKNILRYAGEEKKDEVIDLTNQTTLSPDPIKGIRHESVKNEICLTYGHKSYPVQLWWLIKRQLRHLLRDASLLTSQYLVIMAMSVIFGAVFFDVDKEISGMQNRMGLLFFLCIFFSMTSMSATEVFVKNRKQYWRESNSGFYSPFIYFCAQYLCDVIPLRVIPPILFSAIAYPMVGFTNDQGKFLTFTFLLVLVNIISTSLCLAVSAASSSVGQANFIAIIYFIVSLIFGGLFLSNDTRPSCLGQDNTSPCIPVKDIRYLSFYNYAYEALVGNEVYGLIFNFNPDGIGEYVIKGELLLLNFGLDASRLSGNIVTLIFFWFGFAMLGLLNFMLLDVNQSPKK